jgi:hypothetical protein
MEWKILDVNNWPENTRIFCDTCGMKNRSNTGWIYKEQEKNEYKEIMFKLLANSYGISDSSAFQKNMYKCDLCIIKDKLNDPTNKFTIKELRQFCKRVDLPVSGKKQEIFIRLVNYYNERN